jgi:hypothetical protein
MTAHVIEEGRRALQGLRSPEAEGSNLETAFSRIRREFSTKEKASYRVIAQSAACPLRPLIRDEVYRIGCEALANVILHSKAKSIEVERSMQTGICASLYATMAAESILRYSTLAAEGIGDSLECANAPKESAPALNSGAESALALK